MFYTVIMHIFPFQILYSKFQIQSSPAKLKVPQDTVPKIKIL